MAITPPDSWPRSLILALKSLSVLFAGLIIWQSLITVGPSQSVQHFDKIMHLGVYALLAGTIRLGWWNVWGGFILIFCAGLGLGMEVLQGMIAEGRTASLYDALANVIGAALALFIIPRFWK